MYSVQRTIIYNPGIVWLLPSFCRRNNSYIRLKNAIIGSEGLRCSFCGRVMNHTKNSALQFTVEHIIDKSINPSLANSWLNLIGCCSECNSSKNTFKQKRGISLTLTSSIDSNMFKLTDHLYFDEFTGKIRVKPQSKRYRVLQNTIDSYNVNKPSMCNDRLCFYNICKNSITTMRYIENAINNNFLDENRIMFPFVLMKSLVIEQKLALLTRQKIVEKYFRR